MKALRRRRAGPSVARVEQDRGGAGEGDALLRPSISRPVAGPAPWRVASAFVPSFLAGPGAAGALHLVNARRLGVGRDVVVRLWLVVVATLVGGYVAAGVVAASYDGDRAVRLATQVAGVVAHLVASRLLHGPERRLQLRGVEPASMWRPGLLVVIAVGFANARVLAAVAGAAR